MTEKFSTVAILSPSPVFAIDKAQLRPGPLIGPNSNQLQPRTQILTISSPSSPFFMTVPTRAVKKFPPEESPTMQNNSSHNANDWEFIITVLLQNRSCMPPNTLAIASSQKTIKAANIITMTLFEVNISHHVIGDHDLSHLMHQSSILQQKEVSAIYLCKGIQSCWTANPSYIIFLVNTFGHNPFEYCFLRNLFPTSSFSKYSHSPASLEGYCDVDTNKNITYSWVL